VRLVNRLPIKQGGLVRSASSPTLVSGIDGDYMATWPGFNLHFFAPKLTDLYREGSMSTYEYALLQGRSVRSVSVRVMTGLDGDYTHSRTSTSQLILSGCTYEA